MADHLPLAIFLTECGRRTNRHGLRFAIENVFAIFVVADNRQRLPGQDVHLLRIDFARQFLRRLPVPILLYLWSAVQHAACRVHVCHVIGMGP